MFFIFKILPDWFWAIPVLAGACGLLLSYLPPLKPYSLVLKIVGVVVLLVGIFVSGMLYADLAWKQAARELEQKVALMEQQSQVANTQIQEKVVTKLQVVKVRGELIKQYVDREVVKYDHTCVIPSEFIAAHNRAAESPK